jgi:hypothetical protein
MRIAEYKKIDEKIEYVTVCHEESIDENGNIIEAYDEVIEKVVPIMGSVYREMTQEEIDALPKEEETEVAPTAEERLEALEAAMLEMILGGIE